MAVLRMAEKEGHEARTIRGNELQIDHFVRQNKGGVERGPESSEAAADGTAERRCNNVGDEQ